MGGGRRGGESAVDGCPVPAGYTSNENTGGGRLIVIAVDQPGIRFGGSTAMMNTLAASSTSCCRPIASPWSASDPTLPRSTSSPIWNARKQLVSRMTGQKQPGAPTTYNVGLGESLSIVRGELGMLDGAIARECVNMPPRSFQ